MNTTTTTTSVLRLNKLKDFLTRKNTQVPLKDTSFPPAIQVHILWQVPLLWPAAFV